MIEPLILNIGGGLNSSAILVEYVMRGLPYGIAIFADTGVEKDETYAHLDELDAWLVSRGRHPIIRVTNAVRPDGKVHYYKTLEEECLGNKTLPSLAFGFRGCSSKWKIAPMDRWIKAQDWAQATWARGERVVKAIGYDAGEAHRSTISESADGKFRFIYPLRDWGWWREECADALKRAGLKPCPKSACFFCPATRKSEVLKMQVTRPDLVQRGIAMELNADLQTVRGLGRNWSWRELLKADAEQMKLWPDLIEPCVVCHDGGSGDEDD